MTVDGHPQNPQTVPVTAIVPAFNRTEKCISTLTRIYNCIPSPAEVIVHVDGNQQECALEIRSAFPELKIICSTDRIGPGGSRNRMIDAASHSLVASFDDDSYPLDSDYFEKVVEVANGLADASLISAALYHPGEQIRPSTGAIARVADFPGGACIYRRDKFKEIGGYLSIAIPYGIEEVDVALRYFARGAAIYRADCLRVFHDNDRAGHTDAAVTAASFVNIALLAFLRYPVLLWPIGLGQVIHRLIWLVKARRLTGILRGLARTPVELLKHRKERQALPILAVLSYLQLRRRCGMNPENVRQ
jgi:GT2 family glycosyltransferase